MNRRNLVQWTVMVTGALIVAGGVLATVDSLNPAGSRADVVRADVVRAGAHAPAVPVSADGAAATLHLPFAGSLVQTPPWLEVVGHLGGPALAVASDGHHAFLGLGARLVVLDVDVDGPPRVVGQGPVLPGFVTGIVVADGTAYVATGDVYGNVPAAGLAVIDVGDPTAPRLLGSAGVPGGASGLAVSGEHAYVGARGVACFGLSCWDDLLVFDVSHPGAPSRVATLAGIGRGTSGDVIVADGRLYVPGCRIDISDPRAPVPECRGGFGPSFALVGRHIYSASDDLLEVYDWPDGAELRQVATIQLPAVASMWAEGVTIAGDVLYVYGPNDSWDAEVLARFDVSDPAAPRLLGTTEVPELIYDVAVRGDLALAATLRCGRPSVAEGSSQYCGGGLRVIDLSDDAMPVDSRTYQEPGPRTYAVARSGADVYLVEYDARPRAEGLARLWHLVAAASGGLAAGRYVDLPGPVTDVATDGDRVWVALAEQTGEPGERLLAFALSGDGGIVRRGSDPGAALALAASGGRLYVADGDTFGVCDVPTDAPMHCFDRVHFPALPLRVSPAYDLAVAAGRAWLVAGQQLVGFDVTDSSAPRVLASYEQGPGDCGWAYDAVALGGTYVYLVERTGHLSVLDASDPTAPRRVAELRLLAVDYYQRQYDVLRFGAALAGDRLYVADNQGEAFVVDVGEPTRPHLVASHGLPDFSTSIRPGPGLNISGVADPFAVAQDGADLLVPIELAGLGTYRLREGAR